MKRVFLIIFICLLLVSCTVSPAVGSSSENETNSSVATFQESSRTVQSNSFLSESERDNDTIRNSYEYIALSRANFTLDESYKGVTSALSDDGKLVYTLYEKLIEDGEEDSSDIPSKVEIILEVDGTSKTILTLNEDYPGWNGDVSVQWIDNTKILIGYGAIYDTQTDELRYIKLPNVKIKRLKEIENLDETTLMYKRKEGYCKTDFDTFRMFALYAEAIPEKNLLVHQFSTDRFVVIKSYNYITGEWQDIMDVYCGYDASASIYYEDNSLYIATYEHDFLSEIKGNPYYLAIYRYSLNSSGDESAIRLYQSDTTESDTNRAYWLGRSILNNKVWLISSNRPKRTITYFDYKNNNINAQFNESEEGFFTGFWNNDDTKVIFKDTANNRLQIYDVNAKVCYQCNIISEFNSPEKWFYYRNGIVADGKYYRLSLT